MMGRKKGTEKLSLNFWVEKAPYEKAYAKYRKKLRGMISETIDNKLKEL